jgi:hypothetical protein
VLARFDEGRTKADLILAVRGCALSPHNMGANDRGRKFDDLELICRDDAHVEAFTKIAEGSIACCVWPGCREEATDSRMGRPMCLPHAEESEAEFQRHEAEWAAGEPERQKRAAADLQAVRAAREEQERKALEQREREAAARRADGAAPSANLLGRVREKLGRDPFAQAAKA